MTCHTVCFALLVANITLFPGEGCECGNVGNTFSTPTVVDHSFYSLLWYMFSVDIDYKPDE